MGLCTQQGPRQLNTIQTDYFSDHGIVFTNVPPSNYSPSAGQKLGKSKDYVSISYDNKT